jgi:integrase
MAIKKLASSSTGKSFYRCRFRLNGQNYSSNFSLRSDAQRWEASIRSDRNSRQAHSPEYGRTLSETIDTYTKSYLQLRPQTKLDRAYQLEWWKNCLGEMKLSDISRQHLQAAFEKLANRKSPSGKNISGATINRYRAALSHVFRTALKWDWIHENPLDRVDRQPEGNGRIKCLSLEEIKRLRMACRESRCTHLELIFLIAICTGMRKGEILGLTFESLDLTRGYIRLLRTKNGSARSIPISDVLHPYLILAKNTGPKNLLFPSPNNFKKPLCINTAYTSAVRRAGLTDYTFHDNRHTAASYMAKNGTSLLLLTEIFGWKTMEMAKRYAYLQPSAGIAAINDMNKEILG